MARRSNRSTTLSQREIFNPSLARLLTPIRLLPLPEPWTPPPAPIPRSRRAVVLSTGDRRAWRPDRSTRPPAAMYPGAARVVAKPAIAAATRFADPRSVAICIRRSIRKEVLFALKKTRKGSGSKRRRNFWSEVHCK